jgi:hypothetical protein
LIDAQRSLTMRVVTEGNRSIAPVIIFRAVGGGVAIVQRVATLTSLQVGEESFS